MNEIETIQKVPGFYYTSKGCRVTKRSVISGDINSIFIPNLCVDSVDSWLNGEKIQDAMSYLSAEQREFIMTGTTPEEWNEIFGA
tara:strand:+ start:144 stop:398 length:255 start_codon:yes stop_codon:yes gene_type:complete